MCHRHEPSPRAIAHRHVRHTARRPLSGSSLSEGCQKSGRILDATCGRCMRNQWGESTCDVMCFVLSYGSSQRLPVMHCRLYSPSAIGFSHVVSMQLNMVYLSGHCQALLPCRYMFGNLITVNRPIRGSRERWLIRTGVEPKFAFCVPVWCYFQLGIPIMNKYIFRTLFSLPLLF